MPALVRILVLLGWAGCASAQLPTLPEAFGRGTPGAGAVVAGRTLLRVELPAESYPDARCADDSQAVMYVRAASASESRDDWVVYLLGGGACNNGEDCHARWLGRDGNFGANKLSARFAPQGGIEAGGIASLDARNPFAGWNHAFVYYCSSDGWTGRARDVVTSAIHRGQPTSFRMHVLGASIVDAAIDRLRGGIGPVEYSDGSGARQRMPDLDHARTLLFAGSSAGGGGVIQNVDRVGELLRSGRPDCVGASASNPCPLRYAAVVDASYGLNNAILDHAGSSACGAAYADICDYTLSMRLRWTDVQLGWRKGVADRSCVDHYAAIGEQWRCSDGNHVLEQHLATPVFVRSDLQDSLVMNNTIDAGFGYQGVPLDRELYGRLQELQLRALPAQLAVATKIHPTLEKPGVFGPQCGDHETLRSNDASFNRAVELEGRSWTMLQVLANWLAGREPAVVVQSFQADGRPVGCTR